MPSTKNSGSAGDVLDLMSSWVSHFRTPPAHLTVLGMSAEELRAESRPLRSSVVHDLNAEPALPFEDASFDAVVCCVSVDYLTRRWRCLPRWLGSFGLVDPLSAPFRTAVFRRKPFEVGSTRTMRSGATSFVGTSAPLPALVNRTSNGVHRYLTEATRSWPSGPTAVTEASVPTRC